MTLPPPDTHCWDEDTSKDVWSHSADQMRAYAELAVAAERAEIERLRAGMGALIRERRGAESIREGLQSLMRGGPNVRANLDPTA